MGESLTEQCRVWDEASSTCKPLSGGGTNDCPQRKSRLTLCQQPR